MIFLVFIILLTIGYTFLFNLIGLSVWFNFLWVFVSFIGSILTTVLIVEIMFLFMSKGKPTGKFRHFLMHQACWLILTFSGVKVKIEGKENVPNETFVCYSNHKSYFDPVILYYTFGKVCSAVGKVELFKIPFVKQLAKVYGVVGLDRNNNRAGAKAIIEGVKLIKSGLSMMIFPEGGIKDRNNEEMVNLRAGAYKLVTKSEVLLLPVSINGSSKIRSKKIFSKALVNVVVHKPISKEEYENMTTLEIGNMVQDLLNDDLHS